MKPKTTLLLLAVLLLLCAGYWLMITLERRNVRQVEEAKRVYAFALDDVRTLTVQPRDGAAVTADRSPDGAWSIVEPYAHIRANAIVWDRLAASLAGLTNERTIDENPDDLERYELDEPAVVARAALASGAEVTVSAGAIEPTGRFRYARADDGPVFLITTDAFYELNRSLDDLRRRNIFDAGDEGIARIEYARIHPEDRTHDGGYRESIAAVVEKQSDGVWRLIEPVKALANREYVEAIEQFLTFQRGKNYLDAPGPLEEYGLAPPRFRITVCADGDAARQTLYVGRPAAKGEQSAVYAKRASNPSVFIIDGYIDTLKPALPDSWREKRLMTRPAKELEALDYVAGETAFRLEKDEELGWRLVGPDAERTDQMAVSSFITALKELKVDAFVEDTATETGLSNPTIAITLHYGDAEEPGAIRVGTATPDGELQYVMQETGAVAVMPKTRVAVLERTPLHFESNELLRFAKSRVTRVALECDGAEYLFEKALTTWRVRQPPDSKFESQSDVEAILEALSPVVARSFAAEQPGDPAAYGLAAPVLTATVTAENEDGGETRVGPLRVGVVAEDNPHERYAMVAGRQEVFRVRQDIVTDIRAALRGVVER